MSLVELESARIYYEVAGSGPPLVFAHGAGGNALSWWQQTAFFGSRYQCITFDHPGFRHSSWLAEEDDPSAVYATVVEQLLDHLQIETAGFVAQSMGGWTGLRLAIDSPDRVSALVMAATDGGAFLDDQTAEETAVLESARSVWEQRLPGSFHPAVGERMLKEQPALHDMYVEIGDQNEGVSRRGWGSCESEDLSDVKCAVLFIVGEEDIVCSPRRLESAHQLVHGSRLIRVPLAGHSVYFERAELFNVYVDDFLRDVYPPGKDDRSIVESFANSD